MGLLEDIENTPAMLVEPVLYYRRDGTPMSFLEWATAFEKKDRHVGDTRLWWGGRVSTVWLGLDHGFGIGGPPLIFETMVFPPHSMQDLECRRYSTEARAVAGHAAAVKAWRWKFWHAVIHLYQGYQVKKAMRKYFGRARAS